MKINNNIKKIISVVFNFVPCFVIFQIWQWNLYRLICNLQDRNRKKKKYHVNYGKPASILFYIKKRPHTSVKTVFFKLVFPWFFFAPSFSRVTSFLSKKLWSSKRRSRGEKALSLAKIKVGNARCSFERLHNIWVEKPSLWPLIHLVAWRFASSTKKRLNLQLLELFQHCFCSRLEIVDFQRKWASKGNEFEIVWEDSLV